MIGREAAAWLGGSHHRTLERYIQLYSTKGCQGQRGKTSGWWRHLNYVTDRGGRPEQGRPRELEGQES